MNTKLQSRNLSHRRNCLRNCGGRSPWENRHAWVRSDVSINRRTAGVGVVTIPGRSYWDDRVFPLHN